MERSCGYPCWPPPDRPRRLSRIRCRWIARFKRPRSATRWFLSLIGMPSGVSLDGNGATVEAAPESGPALVLEGSNRVQNLNVLGNGRADVGVRVIRGPAVFKRVFVREFRRYGIRAGNGEGTFAEGTIEDCGEDGLSAAGGRWTIQRSRFARNGDDGVDLFRTNSTIISSCVFDRNADAAVEVALSRDVRLIGNFSRGHRVTCAARLGDLPARFSNNHLADRAFLEKRGDTPVADGPGLERRTDKSNIIVKDDSVDTPPFIPVEVQVVQAPAAGGAASAASAAAAVEMAERVRTSASNRLAYAGLQPSDVCLKGQLGADTNITPLLRRVFDDPFFLGTWLALRASEGETPVSARYRQYARDLGVAGLEAVDTPVLSPESPKALAESVMQAWEKIDETYQQAFAAFDSPSRTALLSELQAQYAEEAELGLPLVEDYYFDVEIDQSLRERLSRASRVDTYPLFQSGERMWAFLGAMPAALEALKKQLPAKQASAPVVFRRQTPWGPLVIAGTGDDAHDSVTGFFFDLGGDDRYTALDGDGPVVIVDLAGNDSYSGAIASGIGRLSVVLDVDGRDRYESGSRTQGSGLLGIGFLIDAAGDDEYGASRYSQGFGFYGAGWLRDGGGDDVYRVSGYGQGFGGVRGLGVVDDAGGNDRYEILPVSNDPIRDPSRTTSMGQGIGVGLRPHGAGGIGILWDGGGRDVYLADLFGQGVGYWYAFGALIDAGEGNDQYTAYHYVQGAGIHLSVGALYDGGGADRYQAWYVAQGCGHDASIGALYESGGNDIYSSYGLSQGTGSINGVGLLADAGGRDAYMGVKGMSGQGEAWYHSRLREYGSVGMLLDLGGDDFYATGTFSHAVWFKGDHGLGVDE